MKLTVKKLVGGWGKRLSAIVGLAIGLAMVSQVYAWEDMGFKPIESFNSSYTIIAAAAKPIIEKEELNLRGVTGVVLDGDLGNGSGGSACWAYLDGPFDLSKYTHLRITFSQANAGINIFVRLLKKDVSPDSQNGLNPQIFTIPDDGVVIVPISDFPVTKTSLKNIAQISVHSGKQAWMIPLNQEAEKQAIFIKIDGIKAKK